jgi:hypothetical protein
VILKVQGKMAPMRALAIAACLVAAIAALLLGYLAVGDLYLTGFPDGHLTDYDKAVDVPKRILMWVEFGLVPLFLVFAFYRGGTRTRAIGLFAALIALALVVLIRQVGLPWYFGSHLGLDNVIGG